MREAVLPRVSATPSAVRAPAARHLIRLLEIGLLVAIAYALFAHGATDLPTETHLQVGLLLLASGAGIARLRSQGPPPLIASRARMALILLVAFAVWSALSLLWSVAPASSWVEANRTFEYVLVLALALAVGARAGLERLTVGCLVIAVVAALYALGGKALPWWHLGVNLDQTRLFSRLRAPLGYWNALGLVCALAAPLALALALDVSRAARERRRALLALTVLLATLGLTYSRGSVVAFAAAATALVVCGLPLLRTLVALALAGLACAPALIVAFTSGALTHNGVAESDRVVPGLLFALALAGGLAAAWIAAARLLAAESRPVDERRVLRALRRILLAAALVVLVAVAAGPRGLGGSISHTVHTFTRVHSESASDPGRLLSTNSGNRWVWWKEAAGAFSDRPLGGWGAGSFATVHLLFRRPPPLPVRQPHSVPLQFLAETGLVGALLGLGAFVALVSAAAGAARRSDSARERALRAAGAAAGTAWLVHGLFDWGWDIPGATLPALALCGAAAAAGAVRRPARYSWTPPPSAPAVALATLVTCAALASALLPALSQSRDSAALERAGRATSAAQLAGAQQDADLAARLNPLAAAPLIDAATIARRRGLDAQARSYLLRATGRQPDDATIWLRLGFVDVGLGLRRAALADANRAVSLDPLDPATRTLARTAQALQAPAQDSATATPSGR